MQQTKWLAMLAGALALSASAITLDEGFKTPPNSAKPHTWYHMMNGNVTKEGITCDFEALARVGIGGVQMFDAGCDIPAGPLKFNSDAWFDMFRHAQKEAKRLGLEICIPNCSGWSSSGGPWNPPANAMKITTFTETAVKGPSKFAGKLPRTSHDNGFYEDIAVMAYPTPAAGAEIKEWHEKIGQGRGGNSRVQAKFAANQLVAKDQMVDLTGKMKADGTLEWNVPAGDWTILRLGYICNGRHNHPASEKGIGLEVDKLSASAMDFHFAQYVSRLCKDLGISAKTDNSLGFNDILVDSYEVDCQNWTQNLDRTFEARKGYSIKPYLPVFAGRVVGSMDETERFLEDFRRVLADLFAENYAGRLAELCHQHGLKLSIEPYGNSNADDLQYGQDVDIPMAEFWSNAAIGDHHNGNDGNSRHAAQLAHVWGRRYAGTESFTAGPEYGGRWQTTPFSIKAQGDKAFADGINRIIYHRFTHQPWAGNQYLPGMTMGRWGMHLDRTQTWWELSPGWFTYQARCQWMLQEGSFVADALYWCGEQAPNDGGANIGLPLGYNWDICATKVVEMLKVKNGRVVAPSGIEYAILVLPDGDTMSPHMLRRIGELVDAGAKVVARKRPNRAPGLVGYPKADGEVQALVAQVWAKGVMEMGPEAALAKLGISRDYICHAPDTVWIHRKNATADWYFVAMDNVNNTSFEVDLRQSGRQPEIWDAVTGEIKPARVWRAANGRTKVTLDFPPSGSAFVVFRSPAAAKHLVAVDAKVSTRPEPEELQEMPHTLQIEKAEYGVFPDNLRPDCVNGFDQVKPGKTIGVNNNTFGRDPINGKVKELEVVYELNGQRVEERVRENTSYTLPTAAKLISAWYGLPEKGWQPPKSPVVDLTAKLNALVKNGKISVKIDNELAGRDPVHMQRKTARVTYRYDGEEYQDTVGENGLFAVPRRVDVPQPPPTWEWFQGRVLAWQPMTAKLSSSDGSAQQVAANPPMAESVKGAWKLAFPAGWDAPASAVFPELHPWNEDQDNGIRYFSGTATYTKRVTLAGAPAPFVRVMLDLGIVKNFAEVKVNGVAYPVLWKPPFRLDITDAVAGKAAFDLEVKVTNLWANRLIGDDRLYAEDCEWNGDIHKGSKEVAIKGIPQWVKEGKRSPTGRHTFTTWKHWSKQDDLLPSGLIGPVIVRYGEIAK